MNIKTTQNELTELKAVRQWMMRNSIIFANSDTLSDLKRIMEDEKTSGALEMTYYDELTDNVQNSAELMDNVQNSAELMDNVQNKGELTDNQNMDNVQNKGELMDNQNMDTVQNSAELMDNAELSEKLETIVLTIPKSEQPQKPSHTNFILEDGELDFESYKIAMDSYKFSILNNKDREIKRIVSNANTLIIPIIVSVLKHINKQSIYINSNGEVKWFDEPLVQKIENNAGAEHNSTAKNNAGAEHNSTAKIILRIKNNNPWVNKGGLPINIQTDLLKTPEYKGKTSEWIRDNAKENRSAYISILLKAFPEKYTLPN